MKESKVMVQIILKNVDYDLNNYSNLIGNLYSFLLPSLNLKHTKKILIEFKEEETSLIVINKNKGQEIYIVHSGFDFLLFEKNNPDEKKDYLNDATFKCLNVLLNKLEVKVDGLKSTYEEIKNRNYQLKYILCGGPKQNNSKTIIAKVIIEHFLDSAVLSVEFETIKTSAIKNVIIYKTFPTYFIYSQLVYSAKWINNDNFLISNKSKEVNIEINISGSISILYNPIDRDVDGIKEEINYLTQEIYFQL